MTLSQLNDLLTRLKKKPEDIGGPSRMDMLHERSAAAEAIELLQKEVQDLEIEGVELLLVLHEIRAGIAGDRCDGDTEYARGVNDACGNHLQLVDSSMKQYAERLDEIVKLRANDLDNMTDEQRVELFSKYCRYCGRKDPSCNCMRDD